MLDSSSFSYFKELNPRRWVYVEIPKPSRVELKCRLFFRWHLFLPEFCHDIRLIVFLFHAQHLEKVFARESRVSIFESLTPSTKETVH
jgi:hypothetical protein